jgi:hypothetical protein
MFAGICGSLALWFRTLDLGLALTRLMIGILDIPVDLHEQDIVPNKNVPLHKYY